MPFNFDQMVDQIADLIAERALEKINERVQSGMRKGSAKGRSGNGRRSSALSGRKLDMHCRFPGCKNRSKGPRFRFLCEEHLKLPKAKVAAAIEKAAQ
jgi:hypothetical protein